MVGGARGPAVAAADASVWGQFVADCPGRSTRKGIEVPRAKQEKTSIKIKMR